MKKGWMISSEDWWGWDYEAEELEKKDPLSASFKM